MMKSFLFALLALLVLPLAQAKPSMRAYAQIAREVAKEQDMKDSKLPVPSKMLPFEVPTKGEGFYPKWKKLKENPHFDALMGWGGFYLTKTDEIYPASKKDEPIFKEPGGEYSHYKTSFTSRSDMETAKRMFWLVSHPYSDFYGDKDTFKMMLRRIIAFASDYNMHVTKYSDPLNDFFAVGPAIYTMFMIKKTYGDCLTPMQIKAMDDCVAKAGEFWMKTYKEGKTAEPYPMGKYANRDLGVANILLNTGSYLKDKEMFDAAKELVHAQVENLYEDGAFAYIGTQNECNGYHTTDVTMLTRYYVMTNDSVVEELLAKTANCTLISSELGDVFELWTSPSWKQEVGSPFNTIESVCYFSRNPYVRFCLNRLNKNFNMQHPRTSPLNIPFYAPGEGIDRPHNYTVKDRNIAGVRSRYGMNSITWTARRASDKEPGLSTLVGALNMELNDTGKYAINAMMMFARPSALMGKDASVATNWAYLTDDLKSDSKVGRDYSALGATYNLHGYRSSSKGTVTDFVGTQVLFTIYDNLFGIIRISPKKDCSAEELNAQLRLGFYEAKGKKIPDLIEGKGNKNFEYANYELKILSTNFPAYETRDELVRNMQFKDLTFFVKTKGKPFQKGKYYYLCYQLNTKECRYPASDVKMAVKDNSIKLSVKGESYELSYDAPKNELKLETTDTQKAWKSFDELLEDGNTAKFDQRHPGNR